MHSVRSYVPAIVLSIGCVLLWQAHAQESVPLRGPLKSVLAQYPGYQTVDQVISVEEQRVAGMTDYVARAYVRDSAVAFFTLVSYYERQADGRTMHSPRNCLPGAGWEVVSAGVQDLRVSGRDHIVNRYVLRNGQQTALAYYWYQGRGRVTASEYHVKFNLLRDAALLGHTEEALVRVVVPLPSGTTDSDARYQTAVNLGTTVASQLLQEVEQILPSSAQPAT